MADNITINIVDNPTNVSVGLSSTSDVVSVNAFTNSTIWGNIIGLLSAQSDLWYELSAKALSSQIVPTIVNYLCSNEVLVESLNTKFEILSAGVNLFDIFITNTVYQSASGSFATNTLLQSTSALLTPFTLTNTLTGQLVLNTDFNSYKTNVAAATATLLPTTTYQSASGSFVLNTDARLSDARTPTSHTHTASAITDSTSAGRTLLTSSLANQRVHLDLFPSFPTRNDFPIIGEANRIYTSQETQRIYAYLGLFLGYVEIAPPRCEFICACSDEITLLTEGVAKMTFRAPYNFRLTNVRASVNEAPTGSTIIVDINKNGTTVLSTKLSIDATEKTSFTAAVPHVISENTFQTDNEITIDLVQVGTTSAGKGLKVTLIGIRT